MTVQCTHYTHFTLTKLCNISSTIEIVSTRDKMHVPCAVHIQYLFYTISFRSLSSHIWLPPVLTNVIAIAMPTKRPLRSRSQFFSVFTLYFYSSSFLHLCRHFGDYTVHLRPTNAYTRIYWIHKRVISFFFCDTLKVTLNRAVAVVCARCQPFNLSIRLQRVQTQTIMFPIYTWKVCQVWVWVVLFSIATCKLIIINWFSTHRM